MNLTNKESKEEIKKQNNVLTFVRLKPSDDQIYG
jgi:hypothetical protein